MNKKLILIIVLLASLLMSYIDGVLTPPYIYKSLIKIVLFMFIPLLYLFINKKDKVKIKELFVFEKKYFLLSLGLGISVYLIIVAGYLIFNKFIDFNAILTSLSSSYEASNFIYIALYISFINSFLEEFFFRGFCFVLIKEDNRIFSYIFSSFLFSFYHVGMTIGWFHPVIYVLALFALFVGGCIFNYLNERFNSIYPSYLVHMFANFAINSIGLILFNSI